MSVDDLFDRYAAELTTLLDKHAPRCVKKRKKYILTLWFDDECTAFKRSDHRLERKYKKADDRTNGLYDLMSRGSFFGGKNKYIYPSYSLQLVIIKDTVTGSGPSHEEN